LSAFYNGSSHAHSAATKASLGGNAWIGDPRYYFADLSGRYARNQRLATWATLAFSSGAVAAFIATSPDYLRITLAAITAGISAYSIVMQSQKAVDSSDLHARWNRLASDYLRLWDDMYSEDALTGLDGLLRRDEELSKAGMSFPNRTRLMEKWEAYVIAHNSGAMKAI
jgi:hypothetical protein